MALVGHISGSSQTNSAIGISGSVIIANRPNLTFPTSPGTDIGLYVHEKSLFGTNGLVSSGSFSIVNGTGTQTFNVGTSGNTTIAGILGVTGASTFSDGVTFNGNITGKGTNNQLDSLSLTGSTGIAVTGPSQFTGLLTAQAGTFNGNITAKGTSNNIDSLSVTGSSGLAVLRNVTVQQSITGSSTLTLSGQALLNGGINTTAISAQVVTSALGFSGSLTKLANGTSYLIASSPITITTGSNGSVTIGSTATTMNGGNGLNNNIITADGVGGLVAEGNLNFDGAHLGISGTFGSTTLTVTSGVLYHSDGVVRQDSNFVWDSANDRLGIGTSTPARSLHIGPAAGASFRLGPSAAYVEIGQSNSTTYRWSAGGTATTIEQNINHVFESSNTLGFQPINGQPSDIGFGRAASGILNISGSAPGAILRFNASSTPLAAGDLGMNTTSGRPTAFIGGSSRTLSHTDEVALLAGATFTGVTNHNAGLSGSLTRLTNGNSYLVAGQNISIVSSSNGSITISNGITPGGSDTYIQFNDGGSTFGGDSGLTYSKTSKSIYVMGDITGSNGYFTNNLVIVGTASIGLLETRNQTSLNVGDKHIVILTGSIDHATLEGSGILFGSGAVGPTVDEFGSNAHLIYRSIEDKLEVYPGLITSGTIKSAELSGSLTKLYDGTSYLIAGSGISIITGSNGSVTVNSIFPAIDDFFDSTTAGSIFTTGSAAFRGTDSSIDSPSDVGMNTFFFVSGSKGTLGSVGVDNSVFGGNLVVSGTLKVGTGFEIAEIPSVVTYLDSKTFLNISANGGGVDINDANDIRLLSAGTVKIGQTFSGVGVGTDTSFFVSGTLDGRGTASGNISTFGGQLVASGTIHALSGVSGSLTKLTDGTSYIIGGAGITVTTGSNGAVTIQSTGGGGDVFGPGSSTQYAIALFDDTTGKVLRNSQLTTNGTDSLWIASSLNVSGSTVFGDSPSADTVSFTARVASSVEPSQDMQYDLGSPSRRWNNIFTGDLHLKNDRGDYTLIEEEDMLTIRFNKTGKRYKFLLEAVPHLDEDPQPKF